MGKYKYSATRVIDGLEMLIKQPSQVNMTKFRIYDWAGNDKSGYYGEFKTFEDAWGAIYDEFRHLSEKDFDEQMSEFYVIEIN